jgi:NADPH2:quinone reductase
VGCFTCYAVSPDMLTGKAHWWAYPSPRDTSSSCQVSIGNASGAVPPVAPLRLSPKNIKLIRPILNNYVYTREEFQSYSKELFDMLQAGKLDIALAKQDGYPFTTEGVRQAHTDISSRSSTGKLLIATGKA